METSRDAASGVAAPLSFGLPPAVQHSDGGKRSRARIRQPASHAAAPPSADTPGPADSRKRKREHDWDSVVPDGRSCSLIRKHKDTDECPSNPLKKRRWGYPPVRSGGVWRNQGSTCASCHKVFQARYHPGKKLREMPAFLGSDPDEYARFCAFVDHVEAHVKETSDWDSYVRWPDEDKILEHVSEAATSLLQPDELFVTEEDYTKKFGSPTKNGKGHRRELNSKGEPCVVMPESNVERRRHSQTEKARLRRTIDNDKNNVGEGQLEEKFGTLRSLISGAVGGTGAPLSSLSGGGSLLTMAVGGAPGGPLTSCGNASSLSPGQPSSSSRKALPTPPKAMLEAASVDERPFSMLAPLHAATSDSPAASQLPQGQQQQQQTSPPVKGKQKRKLDQTNITHAGPEPKRKHPGRPRTDPSNKVRTQLVTFSQVPDDTTHPTYRTFLGDEHKPKSRQFSELDKALTAHMEHETEVEVFDLMAVEKKRLAGMVMVCTAFVKHGETDSLMFYKCFLEAQNWLQLDPKVEVDFPALVKRVAFEGEVQNALPERFFDLISMSGLQAARSLTAPRACSDMQERFCAERVCTCMSLGQPLDDKRKSLATFSEVGIRKGKPQLAEAPMTGLEDCLCIALPEQHPAETIQAASDRAEDPCMPIQNALKMFPDGRKLLAQARTMIERKKRVGGCSEKLQSVVQKVDIWFDNATPSGQTPVRKKAHILSNLMQAADRSLGEAFDLSGMMQGELKSVSDALQKVSRAVLLEHLHMLVEFLPMAAFEGEFSRSAGKLVEAGNTLKANKSLKLPTECMELLDWCNRALEVLKESKCVVRTGADKMEPGDQDRILSMMLALPPAPDNASSMFGFGADDLQQLNTALGSLADSTGLRVITRVRTLKSSKPKLEQVAAWARQCVPSFSQTLDTKALADAEANFKPFDRTVLAALQKTAVEVQDKAMQQQLAVLDYVVLLLPPYLALQKVLDTKETTDRRITMHLAEQTSSLRLHLQSFTRTLLADGHSVPEDLFNLESPPESHCFLLRGCVQLFPSQFARRLRQCVASMESQWANDLEELLGLLQDTLPPWEHARHELTTRPDIACLLVANPKYQTMYTAAQMLDSSLSAMKKLSSDGCGSLVDAAVVKRANTMRASANSCVVHSYVALLLLQEIPKMKSPAARKKQIGALRAEIKSRPAKLDECMLKRMDAIEQGEVFTPLDFTAMAKAAEVEAAAEAAKAAGAREAAEAEAAAADPAAPEAAGAEPAEAEAAAAEPAGAEAAAAEAAEDAAGAEA